VHEKIIFSGEVFFKQKNIAKKTTKNNKTTKLHIPTITNPLQLFFFLFAFLSKHQLNHIIYNKLIQDVLREKKQKKN
jgi:hypothetical protein